MRVLYFSRDYTPHDHRFLISLVGSGQETFWLRLERRAAQTEDRSLPPQVQQVAWRGGREPFAWGNVPALWWNLRRVIRRIQPDVIHAGPVQTAAWLAGMSGFRPLVTMSWGSDLLKDADRSAWMRYLTKSTLQRSTLLVGDCLAVQHKAQSFGFPAERVVLFPWGVDLQHFSPAEAADFRERRGWQAEDCVLLCTRSWEPLYGVDVVVKAFIRAAKQEAGLKLALLGGGSQSGWIHAELERHDLLDRVHFGGQVNNLRLPDYYRAADVYVSASHSDGSSVSLMEALACGKAVLVSDIPGNLEWITAGQEGWLFRDGDVEELAQKMVEAARQRDQLTGMGKAARKLAEQRANWEENFQKLLQAYQMACDLVKRSKS